MDIIEAIKTRKSIRAFKPDPVSKQIVSDILTISCHSPSGVNQQPWEFAVVTGAKLDELRNNNTELLTGGAPQQRDYASHDKPKDSLYRKRQVELAVQLYKALGIERDDTQGRFDWLIKGARYFDAPVTIIIYTDKCLSKTNPLVDIGAVIQTICLTALNFGLGTCIQNQGIQYSDMLRDALNIPDTKRIVTCVSLGYPDMDHRPTKYKAPENPLIT